MTDVLMLGRQALAARNGGAPEWVHLMDAGRNECRDGRVFQLTDLDGIIATFDERAVDLPVDFHHQNDASVRQRTGPVPAAGWINAMRRDGNRLMARVEWTAQAAELIATKAFRYLSPSIKINRANEVMRIAGAGLVHDPALHLTALASQDTDMDPNTFLADLIEMMGLPNDATAEYVTSRIKLLMEAVAEKPDAGKTSQAKDEEPDPAKYVPIEALQDAMRDRNAGTAAMSEERVRAKVEDAFRRGYITKGMRTWATALCSANETSFDTFLQTTGGAFAHLSETSHMAGPAPKGNDSAFADADDAETAIFGQLGICKDRAKA